MAKLENDGERVMVVRFTDGDSIDTNNTDIVPRRWCLDYGSLGKLWYRFAPTREDSHANRALCLPAGTTPGPGRALQENAHIVANWPRCATLPKVTFLTNRFSGVSSPNTRGKERQTYLDRAV